MVSRHKTDKYGAMAEKAMKEAVKEALKTHREKGVPAVFMKNGKIVYLMPDGRVVTKIKKSKKSSK